MVIMAKKFTAHLAEEQSKFSYHQLMRIMLEKKIIQVGPGLYEDKIPPPVS